MKYLDKKAIFDCAWELQRLSEDLDEGTQKDPDIKLLKTLKSHADDAVFLLDVNIKRIEKLNPPQPKKK